MIAFDKGYFFYGLLLVPVFALLFLLVFNYKRRKIARYGDYQLVTALIGDFSTGRPVVKFVLLMIMLILFMIGMTNPKIGSKLREEKREGVEVIIALDVSRSMLAEDLKPNRLEKAKLAISKLVDELDEDKIGLIVFAGDAYVQLPITTDYVSAKMFLRTIDTDIVPVQGTAIGKAIELATHSFSPQNDKNRAIIIITDGENHEDDAVQAAQLAAEKGIFVHTIGIGKPEGVPIPEKGKFGQKEYHIDKDGNVVVSKLNEPMLQKIATAGKGAYVRANNARVGLDRIFDEIGKMEKEEFEAQAYAEYEDRFQYFIGFALLFLILEFLVLERKNRWFRNISLFKTRES
ncbi:MAG: VWA domain-containing protein [Bacteroidota bacterium]